MSDKLAFESSARTIDDLIGMLESFRGRKLVSNWSSGSPLIRVWVDEDTGDAFLDMDAGEVESAKNDESVVCDQCGEPVDSHDLLTSIDGIYLCTSCVANYHINKYVEKNMPHLKEKEVVRFERTGPSTRCCEQCWEVFPDYLLTNFDGFFVCPNCR
jgi:hypothetical protein